MNLQLWAEQWNICPEALQSLYYLLGLETINIQDNSESAIVNLIKAEASRKGARLWRNNVGATYTQQGDFLRYGLANESSQINKVIKSADLIGLKPVVITKDMAGLTIGQFVSREVKRAGWKYTGNEREKAQLAWVRLINQLGGDAAFATGEGTL